MNKKLSFLAIAFCLVALVIAPVYAGGDEEGSAIGQPDKEWEYLKNVSGEILYVGDVVFFATGSTVNYGEDVRLNGSTHCLVAGVVMDGSIADQTIGRIQVSGYHPAVKVRTSNHPISIGEVLVPSAWFLVGNGSTDDTGPHFVSMEAEGIRLSLDAYVRNTDATPPTVKAILNLR